MNTPFSKVKLFLLVLPIVLHASALHAAIVVYQLTYTGPAFTTESYGSGQVSAVLLVDPSITSLDNVTLTSDTNDFLSISMNAAGKAMTGAASSYFDSTITFDGTGTPTAWEIVLEQNVDDGPSSPEQISTQFGGPNRDLVAFNDAEPGTIEIDPSFPGASSVDTTSTQGLWSITTVPEPGTAVLLLTGLAMLATRRKARS